MNHVLSKSILIARIIELIADKYEINISKARDMFYSSETIKILDDDESGLYGQSPLYIFSIFEKEQKTNNK